MGRIKVLDEEVNGTFNSEIQVRVRVEDDDDCIVVITIPAGSGVTFALTGDNTTEVEIDCTTEGAHTISFVLESEDPKDMIIQATYSLADETDADDNIIILSV